MGIAKSLMTSAGRSIVGRASAAFEGSPRIQGIMSVGAQIMGANDPAPGKQSLLASLFQDQVLNAARSGITSALTDAAKGKADGKSFIDVAIDFALSILKKASVALESARESRIPAPASAQPAAMPAGTDLKTLIQEGTSPAPVGIFPIGAPTSAPAPAVDKERLAAWVAEERASRNAYSHTESQMREKANIVELLKTDLRLSPGLHEPEVLEHANLQLARAQELHMGSIDRRVALTEAAHEFGDTAQSLLKHDPVPVDWNIPKAYVGEDWNTPSLSDGPSR